MGYKISAVKELEHWGRQEPSGLDEDELRGYRAARDRVTQIASETDDPKQAAEALREIVNNLPSLQNGRDRGRARALNEALDALEKNEPEAVDGANMNLPPAGGKTNMPQERTPMDNNNPPKSGPGMGNMPNAPGGGFGGMGTTVGKLASNPVPSVPGRYNPDTMQREPWMFDGLIEGEPNKFFVTWEGNVYAWVIDENLEPTHMKAMKVIKGKYIGETPAIGGRYEGDYPVVESVYSPQDLEEEEYELLTQVFPDGFYVGNGFVDPVQKVAEAPTGDVAAGDLVVVNENVLNRFQNFPDLSLDYKRNLTYMVGQQGVITDISGKTMDGTWEFPYRVAFDGAAAMQVDYMDRYEFDPVDGGSGEQFDPTVGEEGEYGEKYAVDGTALSSPQKYEGGYIRDDGVIEYNALYPDEADYYIINSRGEVWGWKAEDEMSFARGLIAFRYDGEYAHQISEEYYIAILQGTLPPQGLEDVQMEAWDDLDSSDVLVAWYEENTLRISGRPGEDPDQEVLEMGVDDVFQYAMNRGATMAHINIFDINLDGDIYDVRNQTNETGKSTEPIDQVLPENEDRLHKWIYDYYGEFHIWPVGASIWNEEGTPHHDQVTEQYGIDDDGRGYYNTSFSGPSYDPGVVNISIMPTSADRVDFLQHALSAFPNATDFHVEDSGETYSRDQVQSGDIADPYEPMIERLEDENLLDNDGDLYLKEDGKFYGNDGFVIYSNGTSVIFDRDDYMEVEEEGMLGPLLAIVFNGNSVRELVDHYPDAFMEQWSDDMETLEDITINGSHLYRKLDNRGVMYGKTDSYHLSAKIKNGISSDQVEELKVLLKEGINSVSLDIGGHKIDFDTAEEAVEYLETGSYPYENQDEYEPRLFAKKGNYIQDAQDELIEKLEAHGESPEDWGEDFDELLDMYTLLLVTKGREVSMEDIHTAWSLWEKDIDGSHESLVPFDQLGEDIQDYDEPFMEAIYDTAEEVGEVEKTAYKDPIDGLEWGSREDYLKEIEAPPIHEEPVDDEGYPLSIGIVSASESIFSHGAHDSLIHFLQYEDDPTISFCYVKNADELEMYPEGDYDEPPTNLLQKLLTLGVKRVHWYDSQKQLVPFDLTEKVADFDPQAIADQWGISDQLEDPSQSAKFIVDSGQPYIWPVRGRFWREGFPHHYDVNLTLNLINPELMGYYDASSRSALVYQDYELDEQTASHIVGMIPEVEYIYKNDEEKYSISNGGLVLESNGEEVQQESREIFDRGIVTGAANIPPTSRRAFFDLKKYVNLEGDTIDWEEFKSSSSVNDRELDSVLEILTEIGAATDMDGQAGRGSFRIDKREIDNLLANKESKVSQSEEQFYIVVGQEPVIFEESWVNVSGDLFDQGYGEEDFVMGRVRPDGVQVFNQKPPNNAQLEALSSFLGDSYNEVMWGRWGGDVYPLPDMGDQSLTLFPSHTYEGESRDDFGEWEGFSEVFEVYRGLKAQRKKWTGDNSLDNLRILWNETGVHWTDKFNTAFAFANVKDGGLAVVLVGDASLDDVTADHNMMVDRFEDEQYREEYGEVTDEDDYRNYVEDQSGKIYNPQSDQFTWGEGEAEITVKPGSTVNLKEILVYENGELVNSIPLNKTVTAEWYDEPIPFDELEIDQKPLSGDSSQRCFFLASSGGWFWKFSSYLHKDVMESMMAEGITSGWDDALAWGEFVPYSNLLLVNSEDAPNSILHNKMREAIPNIDGYYHNYDEWVSL